MFRRLRLSDAEPVHNIEDQRPVGAQAPVGERKAS